MLNKNQSNEKQEISHCQNNSKNSIEQSNKEATNTLLFTFLSWRRHFNNKRWRGKTGFMGENLNS